MAQSFREKAGKIRLRPAITISEADGERAQEIFMEAYEKGDLALKQMPDARRTVGHRQRYGNPVYFGKDGDALIILLGGGIWRNSSIGLLPILAPAQVLLPEETRYRRTSKENHQNFGFR